VNISDDYAGFDVGRNAAAGNALVDPWTGGSFGGGTGTFDESNQMNNADWGYYAVRDVEVGEELLVSYGKVEDTDCQDWFDIKDNDDEHIEEDREGGRKEDGQREAEGGGGGRGVLIMC
jgi:hypothetical protein